MALSFPTSPTSGQVYAAPNGVNYTWNSTVGVWTAPGVPSTGSVQAWVNFNGNPATPTIRGSGNVSSVTKNSAGDYTVNFTTALVDANFSAVVTAGTEGQTEVQAPAATGAYTTTGFTFINARVFAGPIDATQCNVIVVR
jgi:hypothetical protein